MAKKTSRSNPLYVVTNKGQDIEAASGLWDALVKRFHLKPFIDAFEAILEEILGQLWGMVQSYPLLVSAQQVLSEILSKIEELMAQVGLVRGSSRA